MNDKKYFNKKFIPPIIALLLLFICISILITTLRTPDTSDSNESFQFIGSYNLNEITGYNAYLNYTINNNSSNNSIGININVIYKNMTAITANIYIDEDGNAKIKIPLFSSVVYTFNAGIVIPKIINYLYVNRINPLPALFTITNINSDKYDYFEPTGTEKALTIEDINKLKQKLKNYLN